LYIALGLSCGILLHSLLSLTGISYLVHQQPTLFAIIQLAGGSYLLYLGYGALKATWYTIQHHDDDTNSVHSTDLILTNKREAFSKGFATNILNPKALVFFISLMSSLVPADMSLSGKGFALLILFGLSLFWFSLLAWMLSTKALQKKLHEATVYIDGLCGAVFTIIGVSILWQSASSLLL
ncbi:LysE family translocator, partial [Vibrio cyclitrophicus]